MILAPILHHCPHDPFQVLGMHPENGKLRLRLLATHCKSLFLIREKRNLKLNNLGDGIFECLLPPDTDGTALRFQHVYADGQTWDAASPWLFPPVLSNQDLHLFMEGQLLELWNSLGAFPCTHCGVDGLRFAVWAPNAKQVSIIADFNGWNGSSHPMRNRGASGLWELFVPGQSAGCLYKFRILDQSGHVHTKADPMGRQFQLRPETASVVPTGTDFSWSDQHWIKNRRGSNPLEQALSIYELHLGSWRRPWDPEREGQWLNYRDLALQLADYLDQTAFTHVELMPVMEHPFDGSWGYQVTGYFAPSSRFGSPDDFRAFVDLLHQRGYGVILDWVPAHFPKDAFALARYDGSALYEHEDPQLGEHPDWGTLIFNFGRREVRNFLIANALFWIEEFHVDGIRVDAVASMLYLDYSREEGQWTPNKHGGRENLEAIDFLRELNMALFKRHPGILSIAEESTSWAGVSRPVYTGGLGFNYKWNMGWMHDSLRYMQLDPVHRKYHHDLLTFSLVYAWTENFVLVLSHDEVVHGKGSLLNKMPGDRWQQLANLRLYYGWMWCHPGAKLLFMGAELAQEAEWSEERDMDWRLGNNPAHKGIQKLLTDLNHLLRSEAALHRGDHKPESFRWSVVDDAANSVYAFLRLSPAQPTLLVIGNFTPLPRQNYRLGVPHAGLWKEILNTDSSTYGGSNSGNGGPVTAVDGTHDDFPASLTLTLPPLGLLVLKHL